MLNFTNNLHGGTHLDKKNTESKPEATKTEVTYCKICRAELDLIEFKEYCVCEDCVTYIRENY